MLQLKEDLLPPPAAAVEEGGATTNAAGAAAAVLVVVVVVVRRLVWVEEIDPGGVEESDRDEDEPGEVVRWGSDSQMGAGGM